MNSRQANPATLDVVAQELTERAANMRVRFPGAHRAAQDETALQLAMVLMRAIQDRGRPLRYPSEYYAQRTLHLVRWSGSNIGGAVMIEYLIDHGGVDLELYFQRLLDQTGYQEGGHLPAEIHAAIERMREEERDPVNGYRPADNPRELWPAAMEQTPHIDEPDTAPWSDIIALVKEIEARHPLLQNPEMLIDPLTDRFINALKRHGLPMQRERDWYRSCMATLILQHTDSLFAGIMFCLLLDNVDDRNGRADRRGASPVRSSNLGNEMNPGVSRNQKWFS